MLSIIQRSKLNYLIAKYSTVPNVNKYPNEIEILKQKFITDEWTNISPKIIEKLGKNLHTVKNHPLNHVRQRITNYFHSYKKNGNPIFSIFDNISPVVNVKQNFDTLLTPKNHPSRSKNDCYYINHEMLFRAHTTAHSPELVAMGLDNFLVCGDVYRRDEIDATHYPVFHQMDGVGVRTREEVFKNVNDNEMLKLFDHTGRESDEKQAIHTLEAVKIMEHELKSYLVGLAQTLFGKGVNNIQFIQYYFDQNIPKATNIYIILLIKLQM